MYRAKAPIFLIQVHGLQIRGLIGFTVVITIWMAWAGDAIADQLGRAVVSQVPKADLPATQALANQIAGLSSSVRPEEAAQLAECIYNTTRQLRRDYQVVWPPLFNNFLVNRGIKKRGLCFQWTEDLLIKLDGLKLRTVELHWGESQAGTSHENNCIIITAAGQPFSRGILVDCWRHSGRVYWSTVASDRFVWSENRAYAQLIRVRTAAATNQEVKLQRMNERKRKTSGTLVKVSTNAH